MSSQLFRLPFLLFISVFSILHAQDYTEAQINLSQRIGRTGEISSRELLDAVREVPRHLLIPRGKEIYAYEDRTIPLGRGGFTPSPSDVLSLLDFSEIKPGDRILLIGFSSGYTAALAEKISADITIYEGDPREKELIRAYFTLPGDDGRINEGISVNSLDELTTLATSALFSLIIIQASIVTIPSFLTNMLAPEGRITTSLRAESGYSILFKLDRNAEGIRVSTGREIYLPEIKTWQ